MKKKPKLKDLKVWTSLVDCNDRLFDRKTKDNQQIELINALYNVIIESFYCTTNAPKFYWDKFEVNRDAAISFYKKWSNGNQG